MSLGLEAAYGNEGLYARLRQQVMDRIAEQQRQTQNDLQLRASNRADRQQQILEQEHAATLAERSRTLNETLGEKTATNLGPGQTVLSPSSPTAQTLLRAPSLAPLVQADQTLPSTQIAGGATLPGSETPDAVAPEATAKPSVLTGQLRFMGTPAANAAEHTRVLRGQLLQDPSLSAQQRIEMQAESAGLKAPTREPKAPVDPTKTHETNRLFDLAHPTPTHDPNPPPQILTGADGKQHAIQFINGVAKEVSLPEGFHKATAGEQDAARASKDALGTFDQLDQAITAAQDLIGPGEGRVSSVEQMIGNPDPRINELGVMIKASKMRADHAITGSVRAAASPTLIKQWDELLANKITPEALHGTVKALRAVVQGPGGKGKATAEELIKKYGGGQ